MLTGEREGKRRFAPSKGVKFIRVEDRRGGWEGEAEMLLLSVKRRIFYFFEMQSSLFLPKTFAFSDFRIGRELIRYLRLESAFVNRIQTRSRILLGEEAYINSLI